MYTVPAMEVTITSDLSNPITEGAFVTITCIVKMGALVESDLQLLNVRVNMSIRDMSATMDLSESVLINGTTLTYTMAYVSFNRNDSGNYRCTATARPHPSSVFINSSDASSDVLRITTGMAASCN